MLALLAALTASPAVPLQEPASWISYEDYPPGALRAHIEGAVGFRLTVGTDGLVAKCVIIDSSESSLLDETTCQIMTARGRFKPARDERGRAVPSVYQRTVRWKIAETDQIAGVSNIAPFAWTLRVEYDATGKATRCELLTPRDTVKEAKTCATTLAAKPLLPFKNEAGAPVPKVVIFHREIEVLDP